MQYPRLFNVTLSTLVTLADSIPRRGLVLFLLWFSSYLRLVLLRTCTAAQNQSPRRTPWNSSNSRKLHHRLNNPHHEHQPQI